jgi:Txe/YoeB family toxin of Txe-Axe toxin-antitoxin module
MSIKSIAIFAQNIQKKTQLWANNPIETQKRFYKLIKDAETNPIWYRPSF